MSSPSLHRLDGSWQRFGPVVLAGSPLRMFRTTGAGSRVLDDLERGAPVADSVLVERLLDAGAIHPTPASAGGRYTVDDVTVVTPQLRTDATSRVSTDGRLTVDDGSEPPLAGATVRLAVNIGPGGARNAARPFVTTPLVAFLDADVEVCAHVDGGTARPLRRSPGRARRSPCPRRAGVTARSR